MTSWFKRLLFGALVGVAASAAHAESAQLLIAEYSPLAASTPGESESCGVEFRTAIQTLKGEQFFIVGSVNTFFVRDKIPGVMMKLRAFQFSDNNKRPIKLTSAQIRFGTNDTSHFKQVAGEDSSRLLMQINEGLAVEWIRIVSRINQGFWISAAGPGLNATFKLPPFTVKDNPTYIDFSECQVAAVNKLQEWAQ